MAVDTAAKRFSMMDADIPSTPAIMRPTATIGAGPRLHLLWLYSGIAADVPAVIPPFQTSGSRVVNVKARRRYVTVNVVENR